MWSVRAEPVDTPTSTPCCASTSPSSPSATSAAPPRRRRSTRPCSSSPTTGLAALLVLRAHGEPAGCLGLYPDGELTRFFVLPEFRRGGGGRVLLHAAEATARELGLTRLYLDTRTDLIEARTFYLSEGFQEVAPFSTGQFKDHFFEKHLT